MGTPTAPKTAKIVASILYHHESFFDAAIESLVKLWDSVDMISERLEFTYTDYYDQEMEKGLWRRIISFDALRDPGELAQIKLNTNALEISLSEDSPGRRVVNIDPGYLNANHLILATTKPAPHRPYLQLGIYADLTLIFTGKRFRALPWTYPDYASEPMIAFLQTIRKRYLFQINRLADLVAANQCGGE
ncbi:MAG TPA: DUF4416 family protein [Thermodesulfobacteriota bacterium]|nr:DUF4416 family protein [Deltaproteobacteria bacterium]HNR13218.1 DUF4416 family protein [Thermodesulfobacteriota bacterium]HNU71785.1 DUF4416 family protein [Thermodesulfobacteriota bacterium]HOC37954.1 DUF4416 family protein [Thermodesulfobacteriota bacterium]HQO79127.1 DUF4416 family protein [Thermodesulfobacteriota bacterium]